MSNQGDTLNLLFSLLLLRNPFYLLSDSARREVDRLSKVSTPQSESLTPEHEKSEDQHDVVVVGLSPNDFNYETVGQG